MKAVRTVPKVKKRFDWLYVLDFIVLVSIFQIARRPDALAMAAAALIVTVVLSVVLRVKGRREAKRAKQLAAKRRAAEAQDAMVTETQGEELEHWTTQRTNCWKAPIESASPAKRSTLKDGEWNVLMRKPARPVKGGRR